MTTFSKLTGLFFRQRSKTVHFTIAMILGAVLLSLIFRLFTGDHYIDPTDAAGFTASYALLGGIVLFILLARRNEQVWTSSVYRLIPTTSWRLYAANLLSTILLFVYYVIIISVIVTLLSLIAGSGLPPVGTYGSTILGIAAIFLSILIWLWVFISLIHLATEAVSNFLPDTRQKLVRFFIYVVVIIVTLFVMSYIEKGIGFFTGNLSQYIGHSFDVAVDADSAGLNFSGHLDALYLAVGYFLAMAAIVSAANLYLLSHWTETKQPEMN